MFREHLYHILLGLILCYSANGQNKTCDKGWFGSRCQFKCRCLYDYCNKDGSCQGDYKCISGWFGYNCQYQDLIISATLIATPNSYNLYRWKYRDQSSCTVYDKVESVEIKLDQQYHFSWMRIVVRDASSLTKIILSFKQGNNIIQCENLRIYLVDKRTIDIRCEIYSAIQSVILEGDIVKSVCTVFISGGRNVALKGETNSSSYSKIDDHKLAVDGNTDGVYDEGSCTHSDNDKTASWTLSLKEQYLVDRIILYNRVDCCEERLRSFLLTTRDDTGLYNFNYTGPDSEKRQYSVLPLKHLEINFLKIQATYANWRGSTILTLCEVEVFGDCLPTKWGLGCDNDCNQECPKACHIEDGECDTSCVGYSDPPNCLKKCTPGKWGINCSNDCGSSCYITCNALSGYCDEGCVGFKNPPFCTEACDYGFYGKNCTSECSDNCKLSRCQSENGECLKCKDGYTGKFCKEACLMDSWGENCSKVCDVKCYDTCHHENGSCHLGCQGYSDPPLCRKTCKAGLYGKNCTSLCSANCIDRKCNSTTGECFACITGYFGKMCELDQSSSEEDMQNGTIIYVTIAVIVIVILTVIVLIIIIRKRYQVTIPSTQQTIKKSGDEQRLSILQNKNREFDCDNKLNSDLEATYQNATASSLEDTSVSVEDLFTYIASHTSDFYKSQFQSVPLTKGVSMNAAQSEENKNKNRYKNICPYDHNRVHLDENLTNSDYINASHVRGFNSVESFIASQGPHKSILNDFIRMLWEQRVDKIAMLTSLAEDGKMKCEQYWPDTGKIRFGDIKVKVLSTVNFAEYSIRILELSQKGGEHHTLTQFHYLAWPDKGIPSNPWSLAEFQHRISAEPTPRPILVHCSAGAGRTGSYIALHNILRQAEMTGKVDFYQTLVNLRQDRMCMVQTAAQYEFVHLAALVSMTCLRSFKTPAEFNDNFKLLMANTELSNEYNKLCKICKYLHGVETGSRSESVIENEVYQNMEKASGDSKNRFSSILPKEAHRPLLTKESNEMGDYVNAVFVTGLRRKNQYILTQLPLPTTVLDFWRLVTQYNVCLIVAFEMGEKENDLSYGQYLPVDHEMKLSTLEIETTDLNRSSLWEEQKLSVSIKKSLFVPKTQNVIHLKCLFTDLNDCSKMMSFVKKIQSYEMSEERVIFTCKNGASCSGLACVLSILTDYLDHNSIFSAPVVVGSVKSVRPEVIPTLDQYLLVYKILQRHIELSSQYNNVIDDFVVKNDNSKQNQAEDKNDEVYANL